MVGGYGGDRRPQRLQALGGSWGELRAMLNMDFAECGKDEVRRIPLLQGWVNRVASDALRAYDKPLIQNPVL